MEKHCKATVLLKVVQDFSACDATPRFCIVNTTLNAPKYVNSVTIYHVCSSFFETEMVKGIFNEYPGHSFHYELIVMIINK